MFAQYFGFNPQLGDTYGTYRGDEIHDGLDIHNVTEVKAIETGRFYYDARERSDEFYITVGKWTYGHISMNVALPILRPGQSVDTDIEISENSLLGIPFTLPDREHIHLMYGRLENKLDMVNGHWEFAPKIYPEKNPIVELQNHSFSLPDTKKPFASRIAFNPFVVGSGDEAIEYKGEWTLTGGVNILASIWDESDWTVQEAWSPSLAPYEIWWEIERMSPNPENLTVSGHFFFKGSMPHANDKKNKKLKNQIYESGASNTEYTRVSHICDVNGGVTDLENKFNEGWHWNTLQSVHSIGSEPDKRPWHFTVDPCNDPDSLLFPDGKYRVYINLGDFAGNYMPYYTDVNIKNVPPEAEVTDEPDGRRRPMSGEGNNIYVDFTEPMDTATFEGNIFVNAFCRNMADVNIDSMKTSEDLMELTLFLPDTFPDNEAYYVKLTNDIIDIAGTPLDGNANCSIDDYDDYDTIVGTITCNHAFIVQTGATVASWETIDHYQNCLDAYSFTPYRICGGFPFGTGDRTSLNLETHLTNYATITVTGEGVVFPPNNPYVVNLVNPPADTNSYTFTVTKTDSQFTWELVTSKNNIDHYSPSVWVDPNYGATWGTTITYIGQTYAESFKHNCACDMGLTVRTDSMDFSGNQVGCDFDFITNISTRNTVFTGSVPAHPTLTPTDIIPDTTGGGPRAGSYTGFSGGDIYLEFGADYLFNGGCGHPAPYGTYFYSDGSFQLPDAPSLPAPIATFDVDYGMYHEIAVTLGMPTNVSIGQGWTSRPGAPGEESDTKKEIELPKQFALGTPRPNPFNTSVSIDIDLPRTAIVDLRIYDILGNLIDIPIDGVEIPAGTFTEKWTCANCPSGTYFIKLRANDFRETRKMTMVK